MRNMFLVYLPALALLYPAPACDIFYFRGETVICAQVRNEFNQPEKYEAQRECNDEPFVVSSVAVHVCMELCTSAIVHW